MTNASTSAVNPWILAVRPKTLPAAIAPVIIGTAMAFGDGVYHLPSAIAALFAAICIQIGTNFANDYFDFKKGADTAERLGPVRVTQAGLISPKVMIMATVVAFSLSALAAVYLVFRAGVSIGIIAIAAILSGVFYTAGRKPLGYLGLGEVFVLIFFGPVAVGGTYFVQSLEINAAVLLAGLAPGFLSCAILAVNNVRDMDTDRKVGKRTLAVRHGGSFGRCEYLFCILAAGIIPFLVQALMLDHAGVMFSSVVMFLAIPTIHLVFTQNGERLNRALGLTARLLLVYSVIFSCGWILCSR